MVYECRHCSEKLNHKILDLGHQPPSNAYLKKNDLSSPEIRYPLTLFVCPNCWLVQLPSFTSAETLFTPDYAYFSSTSKSWCEHAQDFCSEAIHRLQLNSQSLVIEIASNDGYLLQYLNQKGIPNIGIEPTKGTAEAAKLKGIETIQKFFSSSLVDELKFENEKIKKGADLIIANNVLAHVPNINDFILGIKKLLNINGYASIEFPHLLNLLQKNQFDTIYHEHYSYLSLSFVCRLANFVDLEVVDVDQLTTHGGSLRVWLRHKGLGVISEKVKQVLSNELKSGLENKNLEIYKKLEKTATEVKNQLIQFLLDENKKGRKVVGFGAAAKGNTLLNYAGIRSDLIQEIADNAKSKQGLFMPGSHIPIVDPSSLKGDTVILLPWNLINELRYNLSNMKLVTAIPTLTIW